MQRHNLRYRISDWEQAMNCLSNNSKDLQIIVSQYILKNVLEAQIVKVVHNDLGTLFAACTSGKGQLISDKDWIGKTLPWMTTNEILTQLEKFGFIIEYNDKIHLPGSQISLLMNLQQLGYDKLNIVRLPNQPGSKLVAFKSAQCSDLMQFNVRVSSQNYAMHTSSASLIIITGSQLDKAEFQWDWVDQMYTISDILKDNSRPGVFDLTEPEYAPEPFDFELMSTPVDPEEAVS